MYKKFNTFLNPKIVETSEETNLAWEGCISNHEELCLIERPSQIKVSFNLIDGKQIDLFCEGLVARIFLHEIDHLNGKLMWETEPEDLIPMKKLKQRQPISEL